MAALAGLRMGDVIRSVDVAGSVFEVSDAPTLLVLQTSNKWLGKLKITVWRGQKTTQLEVPYK